MTASGSLGDTDLPAELREALAHHGFLETGEVALRLALEARVPGYSLYRLTPAARKRWKCRYRIMLETGYYDGNSPAEVYARALLASLSLPVAE
ncbi:MAG: hypothetical protein ACRDHP_17520 [Ktedonobacterales bacterium]